MRQTRKARTVWLWVVVGMVFLGSLYGQSLVELARQERARKAGQSQTVKVFTNDDISGARPSVPAPAAATGAEAQKPDGEAAEAQAKEPEGQSKADLEKEYRQKFAELREQVALEERKLDIMQRELNLMQQQYYSDPNVALREQNTRGEINERTQEMEAQKAAVAKAKQAIVDLEEELRRKGLPPGWAR